MQEMEREDAVYFYVKFVEAMIYSSEPEKIVKFIDDYLRLESLSVYEVLGRFLELNVNYLDDDMKENAYYLINEFSDRLILEKVGTKEDIVFRKNKLLQMVNMSDDSKINEFIQMQWEMRFLDKKRAKRARNNRQFVLATIKNLAINDINILITHSSMYDDEMFEICSDIYVKDKLCYMASINALVLEHPDIMNRDLFNKRVNLVSSKINNNILDRSTKKTYTKFKKNISNNK